MGAQPPNPLFQNVLLFIPLPNDEVLNKYSMIKIIDQIRYNTDTASVVAEFTPKQVLDKTHQTLYVTAKGSYFLVEVGKDVFSRTETAVFTIMTVDRAYSWLESHDFVEAIAQYFSDRIQDA
jgi:hypothetical protein